MSPRTRALKVFTGLLLVLWLAFLVGLLAYRKLQRRFLVAEAPPPTAAPGNEQPVRVQKGFVFTYALGVNPSFRLAAAEAVEFASGWLELKEVDITFFHQGQVAYGLVAASARLHQARSEAIVEGNPQLSLGAGVVARAERFVVAGAERRLTSHGPVSFAGPGWGGVAGILEGPLNEGTVSLSKGVTLVVRAQGPEPWTLLAPSATFRRPSGILSFPRGVTGFRGRLRLSASEGSVQLSHDQGQLERVALGGRVELDGFSAAGEAVEGEWGASSAERQQDGSYRFVAEPAPNQGWVRLRMGYQGRWQELATWRLVGSFTDQGLQWFEAQELACALAGSNLAEPSRLSARTLHVTLTQEPGKLRAEGNVTLEQGGAIAWGDLLEASLPQGPGELQATASGGVRFAAEGLEGACQRLAFDEQGRFQALGGVQGRLQTEGGKAARRFAAQRASGSVRAGVVTLSGDARLWEEERLLRADNLTLDRGRDRLRAWGHVVSQTTLEGNLPTRIEASEMLYDQQKGEAVYSGGVQIQDSRGSISCQALVAFLAENGQLLRGDFSGPVLVRLTGGRTLRGENASYDLASETLVVHGNPVIVEDDSGNRVLAQSVVWFRRTSNLDVRGDVELPSQTVYHPPQPAPTPGRRTPSPKR